MRAYSKDRKDANDKQLATLARSLGAVIVEMRPGQGCDWLLAWRGQLYVVEIKDGAKPPSARKLTDDEQALKYELERVRVPYRVIESEADLFALLGITPTVPHLRKVH